MLLYVEENLKVRYFAVCFVPDCATMIDYKLSIIVVSQLLLKHKISFNTQYFLVLFPTFSYFCRIATLAVMQLSIFHSTPAKFIQSFSICIHWAGWPTLRFFLWTKGCLLLFWGFFSNLRGLLVWSKVGGSSRRPHSMYANMNSNFAYHLAYLTSKENVSKRPKMYRFPLLAG